MSQSHQVSLPEALADEIVAINSIIGESTLNLHQGPVSSALSDHFIVNFSLPISFCLDSSSSLYQTFQAPIIQLSFPSSYPLQPPHIIKFFSSGSLPPHLQTLLIQRLTQSIQLQHRSGHVCLFDVINHLETFPALMQSNAISEHSSTSPPTPSYSKVNISPVPSIKPPATEPWQWSISSAISVKKSLFIGRALRVSSYSQVQQAIQHLLQSDRRVASATHNIRAWRILTTSLNQFDQDFDDDKESSAGSRLLALVNRMNLSNVLVLVSRWYGGIKLGSQRFRIINIVAKDALEKLSFSATSS